MPGQRLSGGHCPQDLYGRGYFGRAPPPPRWQCPLSGELYSADRAPAPAHPEAVQVAHCETLSSVPSGPRYTETVTSRSRGTSGFTAPQEEFLQIGGPLAIALRGMCSGQVVSRVLCPPCRHGISGLRTFGNSLGLGRLRAWDLAMARSFGSWRSLQDGRTSLAAGILLGLSELGDIDAWMDMGRLLSTMLPVSPPDSGGPRQILRRYGGPLRSMDTHGAHREEPPGSSPRASWTPLTYSLTFRGIPGSVRSRQTH